MKGAKLRASNDCPFCIAIEKKTTVLSNRYAVVIRDNYPVTDGHSLIVPLRHTPLVFDLTQEERKAIWKLLEEMRKKILAEDLSVTGFNIGVNAGTSAGQTINHCHIHLIPRRDGDTEDATGGVRGVMPGKRKYTPKR